MHRVLILGAGKIGALISGLLAESGSYKVQLGDLDGLAAEGVVRAHGTSHLTGFTLDATHSAALARHLAEHPVDAVISSLPYYCNVAVAEAARTARIHYFDLTEDVDVTRAVRSIAAGASQAFVPQCGLAPGFISIAAAELITHFERLRAGVVDTVETSAIHLDLLRDMKLINSHIVAASAYPVLERAGVLLPSRIAAGASE